MFNIGDKVKLNGCPFDEQIAADAMMYAFLVTQIMTVTDTMITKEKGTTGQWIKTDMTPDWIDKAWFKKAE